VNKRRRYLAKRRRRHARLVVEFGAFILELERFEYRRDGWPLCPNCGDDELWSRALDPRATDPLRCYVCGWSGVVPAQGSSRVADRTAESTL
jgi:hypothetical protein